MISRTSAMAWKGVRRSLPKIARTLGVQTIAEGTVARTGDQLRLVVRLIDAKKDLAVWSRTYEGNLQNVVALQNQMVLAIANEIHASLTESVRSLRVRNGPVNVDAWDAYLKGRDQYFKAFTREGTEKAIAWFNQALAHDSRYAPAYAGLADCYYGLSNIYYPPAEVMPKAKWAAQKALEIDETLGEAHATLALVSSLYEFNRVDAEKSFRRALELKPSDAQTHLLYGIHLAGMGRFSEAIAEVEEARKLDPASPAMNGYIGLPLFLARRYDEIIRRLQPMADRHPDYHHPYVWLALAYEQKGDWARAIAAMEKAYRLDGQPEALAQLGHVYASSGRPADARRVLSDLEQLSRKRYVSAYNFAVLHAGLGERDEAFRWVNKVAEDRSELVRRGQR